MAGSNERSPLKRALVAVRELKARVAELESRGPGLGGPIAVVGIGCRFPGGVVDPESFWRVVSSGIDTTSEVPRERWDVDRWPELPRRAAFLHDVDRFDAGFFGIAPREAEQMDPTQRLLLQVCWHALEDAQLAPSKLPRTGVWLGLGLSDYGRRHFLSSDPEQLTPWSGTGSFLSVAAGRISYALGLTGPALTLDTACSSSLVSTHLAIRALREGSVDVALTAGANLMLSPMPTAYFQALQALASDGRCKTFSAEADGYGRGEGVGVLVLKRLEQALADGDPIRAVIRGSAVNQDGRSNGLTAPSGRAQQAVLRAALDDAGLTPSEVRVIEAHGTGTPLGDPIEVDALRAVFGDDLLWLSSVKTIFGHTETAAGVAGLIKAVLSLEHGALAPHLHAEHLNPRLRLGDSQICIPEVQIPWPKAPERIGVSGFGLSGTNAHVVLESAPSHKPEPLDSPDGPGVIVLSARTVEAVQTLVERTLEGWDPSRWRELEAESVRREALPIRVVAAGADPEALQAALQAATPLKATGGRLVWMFTGQGSQWPGMGKALYEHEPVFAAIVDRVAAVVPELLDVWLSGDRRIHQTRFTQPALYALQCGLAALCTRHGAVPDVLVGHSIGEYVAGYLAGVFDLEQGAKLVEARGRLMGELPEGGAMTVVFAAPSRLDPIPEGAELAARNHANQSVFSGPLASIEALEQVAEQAGIEVRRLEVSHAFHSAQMEPMLEPFRAVLKSIELKPPTVPWISSLDGEPVGERAATAAYWVEQLRRPVQFVAAISALSEYRFFLEIGPHPSLCPAGSRTLPDGRFVPTLHRETDSHLALWQAMATLWSHGVQIDLRAGRGRLPRGGLPLLPFARERHWIDPPTSKDSTPLERLAWEPQTGPSELPQGHWWVIATDPAYAWALEGVGCRVTRLQPGSDFAGVPAPDAVLVVEDASAPLRLGPEVIATLRAVQAVPAPIHAVVRSERPSGLPGLLRVIRNERPQQAGVLIWDPDDPERILPDLAGTTAEVRLQGERAVPVRRGVPKLPAPAGGRVAWITGASGDLGRLVARQVAADFEHVVLLSRSGIPESELVRLGPNVRSVQGDVTDNLVPLAAEDPPDVVFHLAAVFEDHPVGALTPEQVDRVSRPKVDGAWRLHEVAPDADLVLVGSAAAQLGNPGQAAYAIANSWLEGFATWRRAQGVPTWCIALGPVAGTRVVEGQEAALRAQGIRLLQPLDAVEQILTVRGQPEAVLLAVPARRARNEPVEQGVSVEQVVDRVLRAVLGRTPAPDQGFFDAGMDSLMAQDLRVRLSSALDRPLPVTLAFDAPTRNALIAHLDGHTTAVHAASQAGQDLAIIGMAVRAPGAEGVDAFWELLREGRDAVRPIDRWSLDAFASDTPQPGRHVIREAGLLDDVAGFDAERFGISPREACRMDPQQRLVLEASATALEHAGIRRDQVGARTGVFIGIAASEYGRRFDPFATDAVDPYAGTGNESSFAPGRVSHALGLRGPALAINTACSSSLVAVHLAAQALRRGECEVALAGGVHVLAGPESTLQLAALGALSPSGRCHTFSADADGYVRGEGVGMLVLKGLAAAKADGDTIWAVLKGSAVNHDGRSSGVTVPNGAAQRAVLRAALADAGVEPDAVDALEAHGTGTKLGDPIEIGAVRAVYLGSRTRSLAIGSVKTNIGHLEAGAGVMGLLKMVLALHHRMLPAHLHLGTPNPDLDLAGLHIPTQTEPWQGAIAGVSSFGISGTNAHVVLGRAPEAEALKEQPRPRLLQVISGPTPGSLHRVPIHTGAQARGLAERRTPELWRAWSVGGPLSEPARTLQGDVGWLFTGQGSQRPGMHQPLLTEPVFAAAWTEGIELLAGLGVPVEAFDDARIHSTEHAQPALFLFGWSLAAWLRSRGLQPDRVMGHSLGELTAAAVAGVWDFEAALTLVVARGRLMAELPAVGASAAVFAGAAEVEQAIGEHPVDIAGYNGPQETVISGHEAAIEAVLAVLSAPSKRLRVSHPFHSRHMEPAVERFAEVLRAWPAQRPRFPLFSNADGLPVGERALDPAYWAGLIRQPVRFYDGVRALYDAGCRILLEVGARPVLTGMVQRALPDVRAFATQARDGDALDALYGAVGALWVAGVQPDWAAVTGANHAVPAPPSPMNRVRHWVDAAAEARLPDRWFHAVVWEPGALDEAGAAFSYTGDLEGALESAQQAVRAGERWSTNEPSLMGFARSFALEHPAHWGGSAQEARSTDGGTELRRLRPASPLPCVPLVAGGSYLVTGGTGSIGRAVVAALLGEGRTVHALSRSGDPVPGAASHAVDVTDEVALRRWLEQHPVQGVVHCAGVGRRVPLLEETPAGLASVCAPKRALATLDHALPTLDFLIAVSSIAAVWGSPEQTAYAAANAWMEPVVEARRQRGQLARLVALGPVLGGLINDEDASWLAARGLVALSPAQAARALLRAHGVVADVRWDRFLPIQTARLPQPFFDAYQTPHAAPAPVGGFSLQQVHRAAAQILGLGIEDLPIDRGLFDAGMDSVTAVELARALSFDGAELPATLVFEHGTVAAIARYLRADIPASPQQVTFNPHDEAIVFVGLACRFPGGVATPEAYWELLRTGVDAVGPIPVGRWDAEAVYDPVPATPGRSYVREGAFLDAVDGFDPLFFQIAPVEAAALDPQQRLLLEVSWEALERAGLTGSMQGARIGVFVGMPHSSYLDRFRGPGVPHYPDTYAGTGNESSFAAGRVAHVLGTHGPAITLNTACSSSLVSMHLAAEALRAGDCDAAVAGGVSLMLSPHDHIYLSQLQALAADGRCKTFSAEADGYGRGEGAGVVVLMREADAVAGGHPILARLLGSAVNHDGTASGLTVPNGTAQEQVIRAAVARAGVEPDQITYIEAHGTGTKLGDPIEIRALTRALGDAPRFIGSVKTQIGHLEQAAGVASVLKVVLQLQHQELAPHLHLGTLNPVLELGAMQIATGQPWTGRLAGVSGFGLSGTNAHLVIGAGEPAAVVARSESLICASAASLASLETLVASVQEAVQAHGSGPVAKTLWERRNLAWRTAGGPARRVHTAPRLVFLFTGQGVQRPGMDEALYRDEPVYRQAFDEVMGHFGLPLREYMADECIHDTRFTQPALFAMQWALASWWRHLGVEAEQVLGHSIGELTAAAWAGLLRLPDAVALVRARADAMADQPGGGAMVAVFADEEAVVAALVPGCVVAGVNTPDETVISGDAAAVAAVVQALGVEHRTLTVSHAFHSHHLDGAVERVVQAARDIGGFTPRIPVVRCLDGALHDGPPDPSYWGEQLRGPVRFLEGVRTLLGEGATTWLELGPHPVLATAVQRVAPGAVAVGSMQKGSPQLREAAAALWTDGIAVPMERWLPERGVPLPTTPFERSRCWLDLPEFQELAGPLDGALLERVWEEVEGGSSWAGQTVEIEAGGLEQIWVQLVEAAAPAAEARQLLRFVTRGAALRGAGDPSLCAVHGFVRAARRELGLDWRCVDLEPGGSLEGLPDDPWLCVGERVWGARLVRRGLAEEQTVGGKILITGGFGGLGVELARAWADQAEVWLLSRTLRGEVLDELGVHGLAVDVRDTEALSAALAGLGITRVVHAAGVLQDGALGQPWEQVQAVFEVKINGAMALREVLGEEVAYDFYSSASAVIGAAGQSAYAAANAALEGLALQWRSEGLSVRCISWGPWSEVGMAAGLSARIQEHQASLGMRRVPVAAGIELLGRIEGSAVVLPMDWPRFLEHGGEPLYSHLGWTPVAQRSQGWRVEQGLEALAPWLVDVTRELLRIPADRALPVDRPLQEFGLDSMMAVGLRNRLADAGVEVPIARLIGGPSIEEIVGIARARLVVAPAAAVVEEDLWSNPLTTHVLLALLMLVAGLVLGASIAGIQAPEQPPAERVDRAPRADR